MRRLLYLVALLILASMPVKAQQHATQALTLTVGSSSGPQQATQALTLTVGSSSGAQQASQALTLTVSAGARAQATFSLTVLHSLIVSWLAGTPGANPIVGYNVFRSNRSRGPYSQINSTPVSGLTYFDPGLTSGTTYYYVVTAVDSEANQSLASPEAAAVVPAP